MELFYNKESDKGTWEITYDSTNNLVTLYQFLETEDIPTIRLYLTKNEFNELKRFIKSCKLRKNKKLNFKL